jgi:hypothetical protein
LNTDNQLDVPSQHETVAVRQQLVFLGASNLSRAFPTVVSLARGVFAGELSIFAAKGFGRSYGLESGSLGKKFPGIFFSEIWPALEQEKTVPITAWITDIGNDLGYEVPVETILEWVSGCVDRLEAMGARIAISDLPIEALQGLSKRKYRLLRSLFFPASRLSRDELLTRAVTLNTALKELGKTRNTPIFSVPNDWYGCDPIHPRGRHHLAMWRAQFGLFANVAADAQRVDDHWLMRAYLRLLQPESWRRFSVSRSAKQPNGRLLDGTRVSLY